VVDGAAWELRSAGPGRIALVDSDGEVELIRLGDVTRDDARTTVSELRRLGLTTALLTGDHAEVAARIGSETGVDSVIPRLEPDAKASWIRAGQAAGHKVLFAGDGLNDGLALAQADVGIAMATGAASSVLAADGIIATGSLGPVVAGIRAGRAAERMIRESQLRSIGYNVLAVGAAVCGWVNPLVAAVLMPISSLIVIWSAARVERLVREAA
jgi:Cu+-exporting ATPase